MNIQVPSRQYEDPTQIIQWAPLDYLFSRWHSLHSASCHTILIPLMVTLLVIVPKQTIHTSDAHLKSLTLPPAFSSPASHAVSSSQTGLNNHIHIHIPTPQFLWMLIIGHPRPNSMEFHQLSVETCLANSAPFQALC